MRIVCRDLAKARPLRVVFEPVDGHACALDRAGSEASEHERYKRDVGPRMGVMASLDLQSSPARVSQRDVFALPEPHRRRLRK